MIESVEQWLPVQRLEDRYEISDWGRVRSIARTTDRQGIAQRVQGKLIAQRLAKSKRGLPRWQVTLITPTGRIHRLTHRLVAEAFCNRPAGCDVVNHLDNNPQNNHASNLEWTTLAGNSKHAQQQGRLRLPQTNGEANAHSRYTEMQATAVIERLQKGQPRAIIASELAVSKSFIAEIACGRAWKHLPR